MYQVKLINKIAPCGLDKLDRTKYVCAEEVEHPDALLVRSTSLHEMEFDSSLLAIARAADAKGAVEQGSVDVGKDNLIGVHKATPLTVNFGQ